MLPLEAARIDRLANRRYVKRDRKEGRRKGREGRAYGSEELNAEG